MLKDINQYRVKNLSIDLIKGHCELIFCHEYNLIARSQDYKEQYDYIILFPLHRQKKIKGTKYLNQLRYGFNYFKNDNTKFSKINAKAIDAFGCSAAWSFFVKHCKLSSISQKI